MMYSFQGGWNIILEGSRDEGQVRLVKNHLTWAFDCSNFQHIIGLLAFDSHPLTKTTANESLKFHLWFCSIVCFF